MRRIVFATAFIMAPLLFLAQSNSSKNRETRISINDSAAKKMIQYKDSVVEELKKTETSFIPIVNNNNYEAIIELQKRNREKQKKAAFIRMGIGIFFLMLLVYSLLRRKKKANNA